MRMEELDRALGKTPAGFSSRVDQTLRTLKEEQPMKRFSLRMALVTALLVALLCGAAYALVTQGMEWYYNNRFTAYQQYEPQKYEAIMDNLQQVSTQTADGQVQVRVQEIAWVEEQRFLTVSLTAVPSNPERAELHPMWNLNADGEDREEHWLWTEEGFGPVREVMKHPEKELLLFEANRVCLETGDGAIPLDGDGSSMDAFVGENGEVITVLEVRMDWMAEDYAARVQQYMQDMPDMKEYWQKRLAEAEILRETIRNAETITLTVPYTVTSYTTEHQQLYTGGMSGSITFEADIR